MLMSSRFDNKYHNTNDFNCYWHETRDAAFTKPKTIPSQQKPKIIISAIDMVERRHTYYILFNIKQIWW